MHGATFTAERGIEKASFLYAEAHAFVAFLAERNGDAGLTALLHELGERERLADAF